MLLIKFGFDWPSSFREEAGVQLLGSTAKNIAESCEISPSVTLKGKSTSPYFFRFQKFISDFDHSDSLVRLFTAHE